MSRKIYRGELYYADLNPVIGSEQGGFRPVLIIQNDIGNLYSPTVIVAPVTGRVGQKANLPTHHKVRAYAGLEEESLVLLEQVRTIDKQRLQEFVGKFDEDDMQGVDKCLKVSLALHKA